MIVGRIYLGRTEIYEAYRNGVLIWRAATKVYTSGQMFSDLLFLVGSGLEVREPNEIQMWLQEMMANTANGVPQNPEAVLLMGWDAGVNTANAEPREPDRILLICWDGMANTANAKLTAPEHLQMFLLDTPTGTANAKLQTPEDILLYVCDLAVNTAAAKTQRPEDVLLYAWDWVVGLTGGKTQPINDLLLFGFDHLDGWGAWRTQEPERTLLALIERMVNRVYPQLQEPNKILLNLDGRSITGLLAPELREPDALRMDVDATLSNAAGADLDAPAKVLMVSRAEMLNKAGAVRINLRPMKIYSAGDGVIWLDSFLYGQTEIPLIVLGRTAFAMDGSADGHLAGVIPGEGILYLPDVPGYASGHLAGTIPSAGILHLPNLPGYADGHLAGAIRSKGQPVEFVFTCRMWGNAAIGTVATVRMHTTLEAIVGFANGHPAETIPSAGVGKVSHVGGSSAPSLQEPEDIRARMVLESLTVQGGYSGMIGLVQSAGVISLGELHGQAGGYVQRVGGEVSDWVTQDGTNLYIQGVWSSWADGENLQIDTVEFYDPVREGSDLYIRSVNKSWVDGSSANIDTDFFLDPIQTGSNLYIRQDVLGG